MKLILNDIGHLENKQQSIDMNFLNTQIQNSEANHYRFN